MCPDDRGLRALAKEGVANGPVLVPKTTRIAAINKKGLKLYRTDKQLK